MSEDIAKMFSFYVIASFGCEHCVSGHVICWYTWLVCLCVCVCGGVGQCLAHTATCSALHAVHP